MSDIPNLTKDIKQPVKESYQTKLPNQDEVIVEEIPYEDIPHRTLLTPNPILSEEQKE